VSSALFLLERRVVKDNFSLYALKRNISWLDCACISFLWAEVTEKYAYAHHTGSRKGKICLCPPLRPPGVENYAYVRPSTPNQIKLHIS